MSAPHSARCTAAGNDVTHDAMFVLARWRQRRGPATADDDEEEEEEEDDDDDEGEERRGKGSPGEERGPQEDGGVMMK
ncbi:Hypothetical predicted protein [Scomber scombrus]|uniref:Uncharacterized protein n=1 Tax=Scomber scombrus TaxID=13677 RepID=A0AAV1PLV6_SCOSC